MSASDPVAQARRWYVQRLSAMLLALCVSVHLVGMILAVRGGLSAAEILARTQGSVGWALFYGVFVLACALHVPPGLMNIASEWWRWPAPRALWFGRVFGLVILVAGWRAVYAVVVR